MTGKSLRLCCSGPRSFSPADTTLGLWCIDFDWGLLQHLLHPINVITSTDLFLFPVGRTRSGRGYSMVMGPPIHARPDFNVEEALKKANEGRMRREDCGEESADEREVEEVHPEPAKCPTPSPPSTLPSAIPASSQRTRKQKHTKELRAHNRAVAQALEGRDLKTVTLKRRRDVDALSVDVATENLGAASSGWVGGRVPTGKETYTIDKVTKPPFNLHHVLWDGW